ncbi:MAG: YfhO family protein [bacterium]
MNWIFFQGDIMCIFYPIKLFYSEGLKGFNFPLWLPDIQCGFPVFAVGNQGFMYPLNLILFFFFPAYIAFNLNYVIHFILAGVFTYFFATTIGLPKTSALISSLIFMFSGFSIAHLEHMDILNSIIWLPLLLIFMERIIKVAEKRYFYVILAGIFIGIQVLSGHQQMTFYSLLCLSLYFLWGVFSEHPKKILNFLLMFILMLIISFGLSAVQILPTHELLSISNRGGGISLKFANIGSFPPQNFITFILPYFMGDRDVYWGKWFFTEGCIYIGILPLLLLLFTIFSKKNRYTYFFSLLLIFSGILMVGSSTPLFTMLWHLPIFNSIRAPARFGDLLIFSISILSGFGFSYLISQGINKKIYLKILWIFLTLVLAGIVLLNIIGLEALLPRDFPDKRIKYIQEDVFFFSIFIILSLLILILWFKQRIGLLTFKFLTIFLILIDLFIFGVKGMPQLVKTSNLSSILIPQTSRFLIQKEDNVYRIMSVYPGKVKIVSKEKYPVDTFRKLLAINFNIYSHIQEINMILGLIYVKYWQEVINLFRQNTPECISQEEVIPLIIKNIQLLNLLNVKYILFTLDIEDERFSTVFEDNGIKIIENKQVLPRAFVVDEVKVIKRKEDVLKELSSKEFNPKKYVILEERPKTNHQPPATRYQIPATSHQPPEIIKYKNEEVVIQCSMKDKGFLVLSDLYYPGWQVYVDGKKEKIYRAYHLVRAVYLDKGNHIVKFKYESLSFKIGLCITIFTILGLIIYLWYRMNKLKKNW